MKAKEQEDVLLKIKKDRRLLSNVPDPSGERQMSDRRGRGDNAQTQDDLIRQHKKGIRYQVDFPVTVILEDNTKIAARCRDISDTGLLLHFAEKDTFARVIKENSVRLRFHVPGGTMPEGREAGYRVAARIIRALAPEQQIGLQFAEDLGTYAKRKRDRFLMFGSALSLALVSFCVVLMRAGSVIYFRYHALLYSYSITAAMFLLTRYFFGMLYRPVPIDPTYTPSVTVIIPCFNEEKWIQTTILSCVDQNYPVDKLKVIVVDDCSTDRSVERIREIVDELKEKEGERFHLQGRVSYLVQPQNAGKRAALTRGVENTDTELVMFWTAILFLILMRYAISCSRSGNRRWAAARDAVM